MTRKALNRSLAFVVADVRMWAFIVSTYPDANFRFARYIHEALEQVKSLRNIRKMAGRPYQGRETILVFKDENSMPIENEEYIDRLAFFQDIDLCKYFVESYDMPENITKTVN